MVFKNFKNTKNFLQKDKVFIYCVRLKEAKESQKTGTVTQMNVYHTIVFVFVCLLSLVYGGHSLVG